MNKSFLTAAKWFSPVTLMAYASIALAADKYSVVNPLGQGATFCSVIKNVLQAAMVLGVPVAILAIVYVGFQFVAARGNPTGLEKAQANFFYTILGIAIFFGSGLIATVIIGTLQSLGVQGIASC